MALSTIFCFLAIPNFANTNISRFNFHTPTTSFISKPINNSVGVGAPTLKITANVLEGATRYTIELSTVDDFSDGLISKTSSKDHERTMVFTGLRYLTTYYARAKTNNAPYGKTSKFTTKAEQFPLVVHPVSGEDEANPVVLKISLSPIPDATNYTVELNSKADFSGSSHFLKSSIKGQVSFIFKDLKFGASYYARAKSDISTKFGPAVKFITRKKIPYRRVWGVTTSAGSHDGGTVFSLSVDSSTFTKHHDYIESGDYPNSYLDGSLIHAPEGGFFGNSECTRNGTCANGEIFYVSPYGEFKYISKPYIHEGSVMLASNNQLYVVDDWINYFQGGIIRMPAEESGFELSNVLFRIKSKSQGQNIRASLIELPDGHLYGVAPQGGLSNHGVVYRIKLDGSGHQVIHNFDQRSGAHPQSHLLAGSDGYLYGTTSTGGQFNLGTIFKVLPDGSNFKTLFEFSTPSGSNPQGSLVEKNKKLFGTTPGGGNHNHGVMFSINMDGTGYKKLFSFNGVNGSNPLTTPTIVDNYLFGMTTWGGVNGNGVIFKLKLDGSGYVKLHDFLSDQGANPTGSLLLSEDFFTPGDVAIAASSNASAGRAASSYDVGIFPNPFVNNFTVDISSEQNNDVTVLITDLQGQVIKRTTSSSNASLTMGDDLNKGIYVLKVIKGKEATSYRVAKQ
jgi:uncharacterized repeat protein (TIGR03803 family)